MTEALQMYMNIGLTGLLTVTLMFLVVKYIPQYITIKLERMKTRDAESELLLRIIDNNTEVIKSNSRAIEHNSRIIDAFTKNSHKLEKNIADLSNEVKELIKK